MGLSEKKRGHMWSDFGGHPTLHHYNYLMSKQHQENLLREAKRERLLHEVNETPVGLHRYYAWMYGIRWFIENSRRSLMEFGNARERQASNRHAATDLRSLKVIHAE